ncbi:phage tail length tape measure family protein [Sphingomonas sp. RRHST34]|uniref:Phage tail length tape measure family protein n=1 Tax=Sphingomonas citri TaxID=2862499 RepID=A0ABS7BQQ0_9SPHN|nr:phage tail length tape measure family protein [Sphingomonas citri]MBW6531931.1 phage tail length tape measure family protein [Sphingomonas citri]
MADDGSPELSVGFTIESGNSEEQLRQIQQAMNTAERGVVGSAGRIEQATQSMVKADAAVAGFTLTANASSRVAASIARDRAQIEKTGESLVRQLERQNATFGMTKSEIQAARVEAAAFAAQEKGLTELAARLRAEQTLLNDRMAFGTKQHGAMAAAAGRNGFALKQVAIQMPDIVQGLLTGQKPMQVFIQQGGQIAQVAQMAEGGVKGFARELAGAALRFAPFAAAAAAAAGGFALFVRWINQGVTNDQLTRDLGKITGGANATRAELYKLKDETVTWGDVTKATFSIVGKDIQASFVGDVKGMSKGVKDVLDDLTGYAKSALAGIYAGLAGTRSYLGEIEKGGVLGLAKMAIGQGDPQLLEKTYGAAYKQADGYLTKLGARIRTQSITNARERIAEKVGFNTPKDTTDKHAESLARAAEATEAQIRNLYALAEAYNVSGGAALIAEARVKAESEAIRRRTDVEAAVNQQVRLAIAQRTSDASRSSASMRDEAAIQAEVNRMVTDGLTPAERAADLVRDRIAQLPLLQALEAAQQRGLRSEVERVTRALDEQRAAQASVAAAQIGDRFTRSEIADRERLEDLDAERRLIGATNVERARALAIIRATREATAMGAGAGTPNGDDYIARQAEIAARAEQNTIAQRRFNDELGFTADKLDLIAQNASDAARGMADAFGDTGRALGGMASIFADFSARQARAQLVRNQNIRAGADAERENAKFAIAQSNAQIGLFGDMTAAAKGFFGEKSRGYAALQAAEKVYRAFEFAMSVRAMVQDVSETISSVANSGARAAAAGAEGVANQSKLPFPFNLAAMAATAAALVAAGVTIFSGGGRGSSAQPTNTGTGTVLGDPTAKSESLKRSIDALREVDLVTSVYAREMASSLRSIENAIGGVAAQVVRAGDVNASAGITEGFQKNLIGSVLSKIPLIGGILGGLFGSKTEVTGSGLYAKGQTLESILGRGFDASYYSDIKKTSSFLGIKTGTKTSTQYAGASGELEGQFTLILRQFNDAITAAAEPLGQSADAFQARLNGFVVNIGKVDLKGLTGEQIEEKLNAIFGAAADNMANAAFPGLSRFQRAGEGAFETLTRVASTVEAVTTALNLLGGSSRDLGIDIKVALADQFDSVSDFTSAVSAYAEAFYTQKERQAAQAAQMNRVFASLGLTMPGSLAAFRQLVEAQDLTTAAGRSTYAALLNLAPAFADLEKAMDGAKSAADVLAERQDLERQLLELAGDTAAIRALDLAKLDASNRALQEQVWAVQDAQAAAKAADELRQAWTSVGDSIMDEVNRIRGLTEADTGGGFATLMGRFNAATDAARAGDQDAAKTLPGLSQALLAAAADAATSRQELDRIQAQTASSLEATYQALSAFTGASPATSTAALLTAAMAQAAAAPGAANDTQAASMDALRQEITDVLRSQLAQMVDVASSNRKIATKFDDVTAASGGDAISVQAA